MAQQIYDKAGNADLAALCRALKPTAVEAQTFINESRVLAREVRS